MKVVITGASKGLGKAVSELLTNYDVIDLSRSTGNDLTKKIPKIDCDILILNAGSWDNNWMLNYEAPKSLAEQMSKDKLVIFILSNAAYQSFGNDDYTASKSGLLHYARRKQREGYRFCTISPGTIDTGFWGNAKVDNRARGCMKPETVAQSVCHIIQQAGHGAFIREMIIVPEVKNVL